MIDTSPREILDCWFAGVGDDALDPDGPAVRRWFTPDPAFDRELAARFGDVLARAARGELGAWCATPRGALAFVVLCDQLSRNVHRGTPRAFAADPLALHACLDGLARGVHEGFDVAERTFFCMPLMHSESSAVHEIAVREFEAILAHAQAHAPAWVPYCRNTLDYEHRHKVIVDRFGRYPHRNVIVGRASTDDEIEFLKQPGSSF